MFVSRIIFLLSFLTFISSPNFAFTVEEADKSIMQDLSNYLQSNPDTKNIRIFVEQDTDLQSVESLSQVFLETDAAGYVHEELLNNPTALPAIATAFFDYQSSLVHLELVHHDHYHYYPFVLDSFTEQVPSELEVKFADRNWECPALAGVLFQGSADLVYIAFCKN